MSKKATSTMEEAGVSEALHVVNVEFSLLMVVFDEAGDIPLRYQTGYIGLVAASAINDKAGALVGIGRSRQNIGELILQQRAADTTPDLVAETFVYYSYRHADSKGWELLKI